ncbi:hypothetical protein TSMEX_002270, partial [Taenia solium]
CSVANSRRQQHLAVVRRSRQYYCPTIASASVHRGCCSPVLHLFLLSAASSPSSSRSPSLSSVPPSSSSRIHIPSFRFLPFAFICTFGHRIDDCCRCP